MRRYRMKHGMSAVVIITAIGCIYAATDAYARPDVSPLMATAFDAEPGPARAWEAEISIGTYRSVNMRHGNLFTAVPIVSWPGNGPGVAVYLYHNTANVESAIDLTRGMGFSLGEGWSTSYSAQLVFDPPESPTRIIAIADNGTRDVYNSNGGTWTSPAGVYSQLTQEGDVWRLSHKDQSYHEFDSRGMLMRIVDATNNTLTIARDGLLRLDHVTDAVGRVLRFQYSANGRLERIEDPAEPSDYVEEADGQWRHLITDRDWALSYDGDARLETITDPMTYTTQFDYDEDGGLSSLSTRMATRLITCSLMT